MAEVQTELDAESVLMAAVLGPATHEIDAPAKPPASASAEEDETQDNEPDIEAPGEIDQERPEAKAKGKEEEQAPEEDFVEVPAAEEGGEPTRIKVADLLASHTEFEKLKGHQAEIIERVEREATEQATVQLRHVEQYSRQAATSIQAALQLLQPPQPPNADALLNPNSPQYNPDEYHRLFAGYQRASQQFQHAQGLGQHLLQQANQAAAQASEARDARELSRLNRVWPEFAQADTMNKFVDDMGKAYGFTPKELDDVLVDHRQALVARDALAYRAMKAQSGQVKAKVEAKAPKLVRTKQEAKGTPAQARDPAGKFTSGAFDRAMKSKSDDDWAAYFAAKSKAGRF